MTLIPIHHPGRWVAVGLALVLGVVACATPTTTEVDMGEKLTFTLTGDAAFEQLVSRTQEISDRVAARPEVDEISVNARQEADGRGELSLIVWGRNLVGHRIVRDLQESYPVLSAAEVERTPLTGEIHESIARKIGRAVFSLEIDGDDAEDIRLQILEQLLAQGFDGDASVEVQVDGDQRTIGITLEGEGLSSENVIEIVGDGEVPVIELGTEPAGGGVVVEETVVKKD